MGEGVENYNGCYSVDTLTFPFDLRTLKVYLKCSAYKIQKGLHISGLHMIWLPPADRIYLA